MALPGPSRKRRLLRQRHRRIGGRGLLLRDARLRQGLHVQLHRGRNAREIALHHARLSATTQTLAAGHPARRSLGPHSGAPQGVARHQRLLVGHHAVVVVEFGAGRPLSDTVSRFDGLCVRLHRIVPDLHVRVWRAQVVFVAPLRLGQVCAVRRRCGVHDSGEHCHRECGRDMGPVWQEAQILCGAKGCAKDDYSLTAVNA